jgi:hypothetical protein
MCSGYLASSDRMIVFGEIEMFAEEVVMACLNVLSLFVIYVIAYTNSGLLH